MKVQLIILFLGVPLLLCLLAACTMAQTFDTDYVGVSFSPYVKPWEGESTPAWNSYTVHDIKIMLKLVATKFKQFATYSMGVTGKSLDKSFAEGDANGLIARAAAQLNSESNETLIQIAQGIHQNDNHEIFLNEIQKAFEAAKEANTLHPGTVWGLIITNQYVTDKQRGDIILDILNQYKTPAKDAKLKLGIRTNTCNDLLTNGPAKTSIESIAKESDFIMCNIHPTKEAAAESVQKAIEVIGNEFNELKTALQELNPALEVIIGDTGWPSEGVSYNGSPNNIQNLVEFWYGINNWANETKNKVYLFEAFDEPWKSDIRNTDRHNPNGRFGAEAHFGWWKRIDSYNTRPNTYVEKIQADNYFGSESLTSGGNGMEKGFGIGFNIFIVTGIAMVAYLTRSLYN